MKTCFKSKRTSTNAALQAIVLQSCDEALGSLRSQAGPQNRLRIDFLAEFMSIFQSTHQCKAPAFAAFLNSDAWEPLAACFFTVLATTAPEF
jgi:hypothetical protein